MPAIVSPLSGRVVALKVKPGDTVQAGDELLVVESMKMEIPIEAESSGVVQALRVAEGDDVSEGQDVGELS